MSVNQPIVNLYLNPSIMCSAGGPHILLTPAISLGSNMMNPCSFWHLMVWRFQIFQHPLSVEDPCASPWTRSYLIWSSCPGGVASRKSHQGSGIRSKKSRNRNKRISMFEVLISGDIGCIGVNWAPWFSYQNGCLHHVQSRTWSHRYWPPKKWVTIVAGAHPPLLVPLDFGIRFCGFP